MATYLHSGDLGDAIYSLPSVRALGGGEIYFASRPWTRTRWGPRLLSLIKPLIDATGYATAHLRDGEWIDHDFTTFRNGGYKLGDTIIERQRRWIGAGDISLDPWLKAPVAGEKHGIVINRSSRWHGFHFPWDKILEAFPKQIVFIGLPQEHKAFEREFGAVPFYECDHLLEAAQVIAGASLFIGNQSCALAIANGLGKPVVVEVCAYACDCFLKRDNAFFSFNGEVSFPGFETKGFEGRFETEVNGRTLRSDDPNKLRVIARSVHAYGGTFSFFDEVPVH